MTRLTIKKPDDWHLHLRDGAMLEAVLPHSADFARAIIMPNLERPVVTTADAAAYRDRILAALPEGQAFTPLMTLYLTESTDPDDVEAGFRSGLITAVKLYPAGATTNSQNGVHDLERVYPVLERMAEIGLPLCVHGEVVDPEVDIFDREAVFIERVLEPLRRRIPDLKVVMEHVTTQDAVEYVQASERNLAATITVHHLMVNRNAMLAGGIRPHYYCLPIIKRERHRQALRVAATSGDQRFFLGTDSAPHTDGRKLSSCGCAGVFSAPLALPCLAHVFEECDALQKLEAFASLNGPIWYGLPSNDESVTLVRHDEPQAWPERIASADGPVTLFDPTVPLHWALETQAGGQPG
ncbi:dihydroorotase [Stappia taiwanensis]|uniref:Dihydroorotase n=1 Tax=Stappia taiwanensis TaxID=992267 RepID=A0A838Y4I3_9HYPH|nr:dihydroorotase [Stappia taiwanensis]MBA4613863.1 dihydroorotase [Stappia taiwanensis]GGF07440.1 dihydroorotase [Stappia taiwanensis]